MIRTLFMLASLLSLVVGGALYIQLKGVDVSFSRGGGAHARVEEVNIARNSVGITPRKVGASVAADRRDEDTLPREGYRVDPRSVQTKAFLASLKRCWEPREILDAHSPEHLLLSFEVRIKVDGTLEAAPKSKNESVIVQSGDLQWRLVQESAARSIVSCQPYGVFDRNIYPEGIIIDVDFDPTQLL